MKLWIGALCLLTAIGGGLFAYDRIAHRDRYEFYAMGRYYRDHFPKSRGFVEWIEGVKGVDWVVEFAGLLVLAGTGAGRWAGLDFFTYALFHRDRDVEP